MRVGEIMTRLDGDAGEVQQFAFDALLSGLGAVFRELEERPRVAAALSRWHPEPTLSSALDHLRYFHEALIVWDGEVHEGKLTMPRSLATPHRKCRHYLSEMDDATEGALLNRLFLEIERIGPAPSGADPIAAMECCRLRILGSLPDAIADVSKRGRPHLLGLHAAVSYLAGRYEHFTGVRVTYRGTYLDDQWLDGEHETYMNPFAEFADLVLAAAGHRPRLATLYQAIESHCRARNRREAHNG